MAIALDWWRSAVIYQVYPRSFADSDGDGIGDLPGVTSRLGALKDLGVDAIWLSPFFTSPQNDAGYDVADYCDVDPLFGTLADFDEMRDAAHGLGLRVIIDLVPNHSSSEHPWFQEALAAGPGSPERDRYMFREGLGTTGELPPNNWDSVFGGPAWTRITEADGTPGPWYLHLFDSSQPDFDWSDEWVQEQFRGVLRFWLERGVDGFRVDVAHGLDEGRRTARLHARARRQHGRRPERHPLLGAARSARDLPRLARRARRVRSRPHPVRRGVGDSADEAGRLGASRRDASGVQLRLPRDTVGGRAPSRHRRRVACRLRRRRRTEHLGALQPRRDPAHQPARADPSARAGCGYRTAHRAETG